MLTGEIRSQIDRIWDAFWSGGISNPLEVIEQITYLLFLKRLDELETAADLAVARDKKANPKRFFPTGKDGKKRSYQDYRWQNFKNFEPREMYAVISEHVFPWLRTLGGNGTTYSHHMEGARFTIPTPALLAKVVDMIDKVPMEDRDTKGDLYEYMLGKIASAGQNGQFRTPRHIIRLMVEMVEPTPKDVVCDPACGTCGFLVAVGESLRTRHPEVLTNQKLRDHFHYKLFHGFDFDNTMLRIGSMNMLLHGVENPDVIYRDSLSQDHAGEEGKYTLVMANPPFSGSLDYESCAKDLQQVVKTKKTELLFLALFLRLLKPGGRAAVIVPAGVLESDSEAHSTLRRTLVEDNNLQGIIALPHWVFKPYASVATAILIFGKSGTTKSVWFYKLDNDGFSDGAIKTPCSGSEIPEVLRRWSTCRSEEYTPQKKKHRLVSKEEIAANDYDLCHRVYLSGYEYPTDVPLEYLDQLFDITKGRAPAASANGGAYTFITSSEEPRRHNTYSFDSEAICVPIVSATGHGHASMKTLHYVKGKFEAATITAVMVPKSDVKVYVPYIFYYLLAHKDELLVPLMRGAANVSLSTERLGRLRIPMPRNEGEQRSLVASLETASKDMAEYRTKLAIAKKTLLQSVDILREQF